MLRMVSILKLMLTIMDVKYASMIPSNYTPKALKKTEIKLISAFREPPGTRTRDNLIKSQVLYHLS